MHQLAIAAAACFLALNLTAASGLTQEAAPSAADAMLVVGGDVAQPLTLKPADLKSMPRTKVTVSEAGKDTPYEGRPGGRTVEARRRAGRPRPVGQGGGDLCPRHREGRLPGGVLARRARPGFTSNDIIVADTIDGKPLFDYQGPLRIVAPHDKRGARSIRMLQRIEVVRLVK